MIQLKRLKLNACGNPHMRRWREVSGLPSYINASYEGFTGAKELLFPCYIRNKGSYPDITERVIQYEEDVLQELKDTRRKPFGYLRALYKMS